MPKIVDHEHRRQQLVEAAWRVINRVGIDNMTIREIAIEVRLLHRLPRPLLRLEGRHPALGAGACRQRDPRTPAADPS
ncbi:MAG: hypothetical protein WKF58_09210 [Ilumatobacteraceae bacterium]